MSIGIDELFEMLQWNNDEETQKKGIEEGMKIENLSILFQPVEDKGIWGDCAEIIAQQPDEILERYLLLMFEWIQDLNWVGSDIIYNRLKIMPIEVIKKDYIYSMKKAIKLENLIWIYNLDKFMENKEVYNELSQEEKKIIKSTLEKLKEISSYIDNYYIS